MLVVEAIRNKAVYPLRTFRLHDTPMVGLRCRLWKTEPIGERIAITYQNTYDQPVYIELYFDGKRLTFTTKRGITERLKVGAFHSATFGNWARRPWLYFSSPPSYMKKDFISICDRIEAQVYTRRKRSNEENLPLNVETVFLRPWHDINKYLPVGTSRFADPNA